MRARAFFLLLATLFVNSCAPGQLQPSKDVGSLIHGGVARRDVGIALAGGGTKAASYAMGVLAAVADSKEGLRQVDVISSVSGGGYAAFFLYSKLLLRGRDDSGRIPEVQDFFADCIPHTYEAVLPQPYSGSTPLCAKDPRDNAQYRFQQFVRCRQDVLEGDCKQQATGHDLAEYMYGGINTLGLAIASAFAFAPNLVARTIFDWPVNLAPSRYAYREGIGTAYGLYPRNATALVDTWDITDSCKKNGFLNCDADSIFARLQRDGLGFDDLKRLIQDGQDKIPTWIINATASRSRSVFGWGRQGGRDFTKYTLQMSPFGARSGFYNEIPHYEEKFDLLNAVTAAAAFLDSNEAALQQPWRMGAALLQHLAVLDWGVDIRNLNVGESWHYLHIFLPIPLYYLDGTLRVSAGHEDSQHSAYLRVIDGGNNDNLGAYTLIEARMKHIFISDHAADSDGKMADMCRLHNEVRLRSPDGNRKKLLIPGLEGLAEHCLAVKADSECPKDNRPWYQPWDPPCQTVPGVEDSGMPDGNYDVKEWKYPVLLGCIRPLNDESKSCDGTEETRVYLLKPALDLASFKDSYLQHLNGKYQVKQEACPASTRNVCEVAAYIAEALNTNESSTNIGRFPQHGTVTMTWGSTGKWYGAYRDLARWHMGEALKWKAKSPAEFAQEVNRQLNDPIRTKP